MIESTSCISSDSFLDFPPFTITKLVGQANENNITFFGEVFWFLSRINNHFIHWAFISHNFTSYNLRCFVLEWYYLISFFHVFLDFLRISQCFNLSKENLRIFLNLFWIFSLNVLRYWLIIIRSINF